MEPEKEEPLNPSYVVLSHNKTFKANSQTLALIPKKTKKLFVGLGWAIAGKLEIDSSCILLSAFPNPSVKHIVDFGNLRAPGVHHFGGDTVQSLIIKGDDEKISINLTEIPSDVHSLVISANVYSDGNFSQVANSYIRLVDEGEEHTLLWYPIQKTMFCECVVFGRLFRCDGGWGYQSLGWGCNGQRASEEEPISVITEKKKPDIVDSGGECRFEDKVYSRFGKANGPEKHCNPCKIC